MSAALSFGDTFTLPATGDDIWKITDTRPSSYLPPENIAMPHHAEVARAVCTQVIPGWGHKSSHVARYEVGTGWVLFGNGLDPELVSTLERELNDLDVKLAPRTDEEWRSIHFAELQQELRQALGTTMLGGPDRAVTPHPLVSVEETIAFAVATVAEIASQRPGAAIFDPIYWTTIERLRA